MLKNSIPTLQQALTVSNASNVVLKLFGEILAADWKTHTCVDKMQIRNVNENGNYINHCAFWGAPVEDSNVCGPKPYK
jgi:hypothetical protein